MHEAVGRTQTQTDVIDKVRAGALLAALDIERQPLKRGMALPPFVHQAFFWAPALARDLGADGHPRLGGFIPDLGLPARMWAGGRLSFLNPLVVGRKAERTSTIEQIEHKTGRTGVLAFVSIRHEITQGGRLAVTEWQDLVYRSSSARGSPRAPRAPEEADASVAVRFPETMLFRYSALTLNAHRIHYDADYCRKELGFKAPVVHGPLLAQMLMLLAEAELGTLRHFEFRATAPLLVGDAAALCWRRDGTAWVRGPDGDLVMSATAS